MKSRDEALGKLVPAARAFAEVYGFNLAHIVKMSLITVSMCERTFTDLLQANALDGGAHAHHPFFLANMPVEVVSYVPAGKLRLSLSVVV